MGDSRRDTKGREWREEESEGGEMKGSYGRNGTTFDWRLRHEAGKGMLSRWKDGLSVELVIISPQGMKLLEWSCSASRLLRRQITSCLTSACQTVRFHIIHLLKWTVIVYLETAATVSVRHIEGGTGSDWTSTIRLTSRHHKPSATAAGGAAAAPNLGHLQTICRTQNAIQLGANK